MKHFTPPVCEPPSAIATARGIFKTVYSVPTTSAAIDALTECADALRATDTPAARETAEMVTVLVAELSARGGAENPLDIQCIRDAGRADALAATISSRFATMERTGGTGPAVIPFKPRSHRG